MKTHQCVWGVKSDFITEEIIKNCIRNAGTVPSGANHHPLYFVAISDAEFKQQWRVAAEEEVKKFYGGGGGDKSVQALEPLGSPRKSTIRRLRLG